MPKITRMELCGKVQQNPYGNWSDVDKGWYINHENIESLVYELEGKNVRVTVEVLPDEDED